jgi:hypothetical protein
MQDIGQMRLTVRALEDHIAATPVTWFEGVALKREDLREWQLQVARRAG